MSGKIKSGVLRKTTYIHTVANVVLKIPKGTKVTVANGELTFNPVDGVKVLKCGEEYLVCLWDSWFLVQFPNGVSKGVPYPFSML